MDILNINESIRNKIYSNFCIGKELDNIGFINYVLYLKNQNYEYYKNYIGLLYPTYYIISKELFEDDEENYDDETDIYGNDEKYYDDEYDVDDEDKYDFSYEEYLDIDKIENIDNLLNIIDDYPPILVDILNKVNIFCKLDSFKIRCLLKKYKDETSFFMNFSKFWIIDYLDFCHDITKEELLYLSSLNDTSECNEIDELYSQMIFICDYLEKLNIYDKENYKKIFLSILNDSYKYQKYLQLVEKDDSDECLNFNIDYIENNVLKDLDNDCINPNFSDYIIDYFMEYNSKEKEYKEKIDNYFIENKSKIKKLNEKKKY